jgi:hypothetical protein
LINMIWYRLVHMAFNKIIAVTTIAAALSVGAWALRPEHAPAAPPPVSIAITTTALPLNRDDPGQDRIGALKFLGAVQLRSTDPIFGGISALRAGKAIGTGVQLLGVSDTGNWLAFETVEQGGRLIGVSPMMITPIRQPDGNTARTKADGDAEAIEWNPVTGAATIAFEQDHRLVHFAGIDPAIPASLTALPTRIERLTPMTGWPLNGGAEAMAELPDGSRIIISEQRKRPDGSHIALLTRAGTTHEIAIESVAGHSPTDAVAIDATRILVLHRRFDLMGQGTALSLIDLGPALKSTPTEPLSALLLARWQAPVTLDNMEGLALRHEGDRLFLYIISDDNLNSLQQTVLMKFELVL